MLIQHLDTGVNDEEDPERRLKKISCEMTEQEKEELKMFQVWQTDRHVSKSLNLNVFML